MPENDPFFDDKPEVYWARIKKEKGHKPDCKIDEPPAFSCSCGKALKPTRTRKRKATLDPILTKEAERAKDIKDLNSRTIPIANLRMMLAELGASGITKVPLGNLLLMIDNLLKETINDED